MSALNIIQSQLVTAGKQLAAMYNQAPAEFFDTKLTENGMTAGQQLEHLAEAYQATLVSADGGEYKDWGTFSLGASDNDDLVSKAFAKRDEAIAKLMTLPEDRAANLATDYIIFHDAYHVGQLALIRLEVEPDWDSYSMYA